MRKRNVANVDAAIRRIKGAFSTSPPNTGPAHTLQRMRSAKSFLNKKYTRTTTASAATQVNIGRNVTSQVKWNVKK